MVSKKFRINQYLTLKLEEDKTIIYIEEESFRQCKYLLLNIPIKDITFVNELESIDEASEKLSHDLEPSDEFSRVNEIPPEIEFWGHCSNLQVWYENDYDTKLLHSNLAFPLLKKLTEVGDPLAKKVFKEEIAKRYNTGVESVRTYLENRNYLNYLTKEEFYSLLDTEYDLIKELEELTYKDWLKIEIKNGEVIGLTHHGEKLTQFPDPIRKLNGLQKLDLSFNLIKRVPEWIGELESLRQLYLNHNKLIKLPDSIGELKKLEVFEAIDNELTNLPESIGNLKSLKKLNLFNNKLKEMPSSIGGLTRLEELDLHENNIDSIPESIGGLKNLKILDIGRNNITFVPDSIGNLCSLEILCINENHIDELSDTLQNLNKLEILDISKNNFSSLRKPFESLVSLRKLNLSGNPFKGIPGFVYKLPNLHLINIKDTQIRKSGIMKKNLKEDVEIYNGSLS